MAKPRTFETTFNTYNEIRQIGEGGASQVLEVKDQNGEIYALKLLKRNHPKNSSLAKRFTNEVSFCIKNSHKNIVEILDHGLYSDEGKTFQFCVLKKYDKSLREIIVNGVREDKVIKYLNQIMDGIEAAHLLGVFHRDIKPENILYEVSADNLVISDFGIASFNPELAETLVETKPGTRLANFQYASPEQRNKGQTVDHRSDIFSLGLILNEICTKEIIVGTDYKTIKTIFPSLAYLDLIVQKMTSQLPDTRYSNIAQIKKDLLGRSAEFVQMQRLNKEKNKVIAESEYPDDPLMLFPNEIIGVDIKEDRLIIKLKYRPNQEWIFAFTHMGNFTSSMGYGPETFEFSGNEVISRECDEYVHQKIVDYFKEWLSKTHQVYKENVISTREQNRRAEIEQQRVKINAEEMRLNALRKIQF